MAADIEEGVNLAVLGANDDDRFAGDLEKEVVPGVGDAAGMVDVQPFL